MTPRPQLGAVAHALGHVSGWSPTLVRLVEGGDAVLVHFAPRRYQATPTNPVSDSAVGPRERSVGRRSRPTVTTPSPC